MAGEEGTRPLAERVVAHYLTKTTRSYTLALLRATEELLGELVAAHPEGAATLDAIFRVAGGEGLRDLVRIYGPRLLEVALKGEEMAQPDILVFVDVHDDVRRDAEGTVMAVQYEVWCPGRTLARAYLNQAQTAATTLVQGHGVSFVPSLRQALLAFPQELSSHFTLFVQQLLTPLLARYGIAGEGGRQEPGRVG